MGCQALDKKLPGYVLLITLSAFCSHRHRRVSESTYKFRIHKSYNFFKGAIIRQRFFSLFGLLVQRRTGSGYVGEKGHDVQQNSPQPGVEPIIIRLTTSPPLMFMSEQETQNVLLLLTT